MKTYGITGTMGSGKSTVAKMLKEFGAGVIDADEIAREIVKLGSPTLKEIVNQFGKEALNEDGTLNRKRVANIVFNDNEKLDLLNEITHSKILDKIKIRISKNRENGCKINFIEATLIKAEGKLKNLLNGLIIVTSNKENQIERVIKRDKISSKEVEARINSQMADEDIIKYADFVIKNESDIGNLKEQVFQLWKVLANNE